MKILKSNPGFWSRAGGFAFAALLALALPMVASAQVTVTAHELKLGLKGVGQLEKDSGDLEPDKFSANSKTLFEVCTAALRRRPRGSTSSSTARTPTTT